MVFDGLITPNEGPFANLVLKAQVVDVVLMYETEDKTGQIRSGHLDLSGDLKPICLTLDAENDDLHVTVHRISFQFAATELFDIKYVDPGIVLRESQDDRLFYMTVTISDNDNASLFLRVLDKREGIFEGIGLVHMRRHPHPEPEYAAFFAAFLADLDEETKASSSMCQLRRR
jgi:hypothetical protein